MWCSLTNSCGVKCFIRQSHGVDAGYNAQRSAPNSNTERFESCVNQAKRWQIHCRCRNSWIFTKFENALRALSVAIPYFVIVSILESKIYDFFPGFVRKNIVIYTFSRHMRYERMTNNSKLMCIWHVQSLCWQRRRSDDADERQHITVSSLPSTQCNGFGRVHVAAPMLSYKTIWIDFHMASKVRERSHERFNAFHISQPTDGEVNWTDPDSYSPWSNLISSTCHSPHVRNAIFQYLNINQTIYYYVFQLLLFLRFRPAFIARNSQQSIICRTWHANCRINKKCVLCIVCAACSSQN